VKDQAHSLRNARRTFFNGFFPVFELPADRTVGLSNSSPASCAPQQGICLDFGFEDIAAAARLHSVRHEWSAIRNAAATGRNEQSHKRPFGSSEGEPPLATLSSVDGGSSYPHLGPVVIILVGEKRRARAGVGLRVASIALGRRNLVRAGQWRHYGRRGERRGMCVRERRRWECRGGAGRAPETRPGFGYSLVRRGLLNLKQAIETITARDRTPP
jgi:hypothetical protein